MKLHSTKTPSVPGEPQPQPLPMPLPILLPHALPTMPELAAAKRPASSLPPPSETEPEQGDERGQEPVEKTERGEQPVKVGNWEQDKELTQRFAPVYESWFQPADVRTHTPDTHTRTSLPALPFKISTPCPRFACP